MSDTSVVFNVIGRERVGQALSRVRSLFRSAGQEAQRATRAAAVDTKRLDDQIGEVERSLAALNAEFAATGNKELFAKMKRDRSLLTQLRSVRKELGATNDAANRLGQDGDRAGGMLARLGAAAGGMLASGLQNAGTGLTNLTTNVWNLIPAALGAAAGLMALGPAAFLAGGAIGSLPAIIAGAAAALAVFKLGFMGLSEAYNKATTATGGGAGAARDMTAAHRAVASAAKDVTRAERDVADALKDARAAHLAVADAIGEERRRRGELSRDLAAASLDEEDAADAVKDALAELTAARANGAAPDDVADLDRAYRRAQLTLASTKARVTDLNAQQKDATKTGVLGSDLVVQAKDREAQAVRRVADAQDRQKESVQRLADAQKALNAPAAGGGGGGGGLSSPKLAASAQKFLNVIIGLRPAFDRLRLNVQEKLFAGLGDKMKTLAAAWLPQLNTSLGAMATTFNGIAGKFMDTAAKPEFITNIAKGVEGVRSALDKVGKVAAGPLMTAFGQLAGASRPFVDALGGEVAKVLGDLSKKIDTLSKSGKLDAFFVAATDVMRDAFRMLRSIGSIAGSVMGLLFGGGEGTKGPWKSLADTLADVAAWFKDPATQASLTELVTEIKDYGGQLVALFKGLAPVAKIAMFVIGLQMKYFQWQLRMVVKAVQWVGKAIKWVGDNAPKWWAKISTAFTTAKNWVVAKGTQLITWFKGLPARIGRAASGMWNGLKNSFKGAINWIIGRWNNLSFTIGGGSFAGLPIPSASFGTPNIPYLAKGGTATRAGLSVVGDKGPELLNMPRGASVIPLNRAAGGPTVVELRPAAGADGPLMRAVITGLRYAVRTEGQGSVQKFLGTKG